MKIKNKRHFRRGYVGIEVVIITAIMLIVGAIAIRTVVGENGSALNVMNSGIDDTPSATIASGINIAQDTVEMGVGRNSSVLLHWSYRPYDTVPAASPSSIVWTIDNPAIATISQEGRVTASAVGTAVATLTVTVGGEI